MEVRNLAEQSKQATAQVKAILNEIQRATNVAVMATEEGTKGVDYGVQLTDQASATMEHMTESISESAVAVGNCGAVPSTSNRYGADCSGYAKYQLCHHAEPGGNQPDNWCVNWLRWLKIW